MANNSNNPIKYSDLVQPDNSITDLIKQLESLGTTYQSTLKSVKDEAIQIKAQLQGVSGATGDSRKKISDTSKEVDRLAKARQQLAFAESENAKELATLQKAQREANEMNKLAARLADSAEGSYNKLSAQYSINKIVLNNMSAAERKATIEGKALEAETKAIYEEMKQLQEDTGKTALNVGNYEEAIKSALGANTSFGNSIMALSKSGEGSGFSSFFKNAGDSAAAFGKTLLGLLANPVFLAIAGVAGVVAGFKFWYDYNKGLMEASRLTTQFTGLHGDEMKQYRSEVEAVADTFDKDFKEVLEATNVVAKQFGISQQEALTAVKDGFVSGADASGEYLDIIKEYPAYFKEAGINARQFIAITTQATNQGVFSDKAVDTIKEGNLRIREMTVAAQAALKGIGLDANQIQKDLQTGSKTTFDVMQEVSQKLSELPDSASQVGKAIADIFGDPGEDAGLQYIRTLKDIDTNLDNVKVKQGQLGKIQEEQIQATAELNSVVAALFDKTGGTFETMIGNAKIFATQSLTSIIKGLINVTNYFIDLYNRSLLFRAVVNAIGANFKTTFDVVIDVIKFVGKELVSLGKIIRGVFTLNVNDIAEGTRGLFGGDLVSLIKEVTSDGAKALQDGVKNMQKKVKPITIPVTTTASTKTYASNAGSGRVTTNTPNTSSTNTKTKTTKPKDETNAIEQAYKANLEATRKYQDAVLNLMDDGYDKQKQKILYQYDRQEEDLRHSLATQKNLTQKARTDINNQIDIIEKQKTKDLEKLETERQTNLLNTQKESIALQLQNVKKGSQDELNLKLQQIEVEKKLALAQNAAKPKEQQQDGMAISNSFGSQTDAAYDAYKASQLEQFDAQQKLAQSEFDLLESTEKKKTDFKLKAERDRLQKLLDLNKEGGTKMSDQEIQTVQNTIAKINGEIDKNKKKAPQDLFEVVGLDIPDEKKEAINTAISSVTDSLNSLMETRISAAQAAVTQANSEVQSAQTALAAEITARHNGYASNVELARKEVDNAKKNQQKALQNQEEAQKAQLALEAVQQASSLVTASAKIWAQLGFPFAIPAIAVMWGSFAFAKIKAFQAVKSSSESYGDGTVEMLEGGSHASGNDIDLGTKKDGTRRRAEGGEFFAVINKRNSKKYRGIIPSLIKSLNSGTFEDKYLKAYNSDASLNIFGNSSPDLDGISSDVRAIKEQNKRKIIVGPNGQIIEIYKNLKRKYK